MNKSNSSPQIDLPFLGRHLMKSVMISELLLVLDQEVDVLHLKIVDVLTPCEYHFQLLLVKGTLVAFLL